MGNVIVILILAVIIGLAVHSLWKKKKNGGGCSGNCGGCNGCH